MLDSVLYVVSKLWVSIGPLVILGFFLFAAAGKVKLSNLFLTIGVFVAGVVLFLTEGYNIIGIFTELYNATRGTAEIVKYMQHAQGFMLAGYTIIKYLLKILVYILIMHPIVRRFLRNKSKSLARGSTKKLIAVIVMILMAPIVSNLNFNLEFFIKYEAHITLIMVALIIFIEACKFIFSKIRASFRIREGAEKETSSLQYFLVSMLVSFILLLLDAGIVGYLDRMVINLILNA